MLKKPRSILSMSKKRKNNLTVKNMVKFKDKKTVHTNAGLAITLMSSKDNLVKPMLIYKPEGD